MRFKTLTQIKLKAFQTKQDKIRLRLVSRRVGYAIVERGLRRASPVMGVRSWMGQQGRRPRYSVPSFLGIEPRNGYNCGNTGW